MKKVILGVLALIFAIALVTGGYILFSSRSLQKYAVEEGISCPYSWQELRSGTYRLEIDTTAYPDHSWSVEAYPKNVVAAVEEVSSEPGKAVFSILPLNMGQTYVQVYCEQTDPVTVRRFEIGMQISVSEEKKITVEKTEEKDYAGITTMGEEGALQWWADPEGVVNLLIAGDSGQWAAADYDPAAVDVTGPFYRQDSCGFELRGMQAGTFPLTIHDGAKAFRLEVAVTEELTASIITCAVDTYIIDASEEHLALEAVVGRNVSLPAQAAVKKYSIADTGGTVRFTLRDALWYWRISTEKTEEQLVGDVVDYAAETASAEVGGLTLQGYGMKDGAVVSWSDGACAMTLTAEKGVALADAMAVAGEIVEANNE